MGADALVRLRVTGGANHERLAWADGSEVTVPERVLDALGVTSDARQRGELVLPRQLPAISADEAARLRLSHAFTDRPPASARLPVSYQVVPGALRGLIASAIGRWNRARIQQWARFPTWPLDLSADFLADLAGVERWRAPSGPAPVMLSHDLDSPEGLENLVKSFLPLEEAAGARSTNFVVPCGYAIDHGLLGDVRARGHEVGVHGYDHANRTPFAADAERRQRLDAARPLVERYGDFRLSCAVALANACTAARSGVALPLRQQHAHVRRVVSGAQQRLRQRQTVRRGGHHRNPDQPAARRKPSVSGLLAARDLPISGSPAHGASRRLAASSCC